MDLALRSGENRVVRTRRAIAFFSSPTDIDLLGLILRTDEGLIDRLKERADADPGVLAHLVIDEVADEMFVHGNWQLRCDGKTVPLAEPCCPSMFSTITACSSRTIEERFTFLVEGCVPAGGFTLTGNNDTLPDAHFELLADPLQPPDPANPEGASATSSVFDSPGIDLHEIGQNRSAAGRAAATEHPHSPAEPAAADPTPPLAPAAEASDPGESAAERGDATVWSFRDPPVALSLDGGETTAWPPSAPSETTDHGLQPDTTQPLPASSRAARLDFGEFGTVSIRVGLVVGRAPLAPTSLVGFDTLVVRDTKVSRSHLELRVDDQTLWVRDLGSSNGSVLRTTTDSTHDIPTTEPGLQITPGDRIEMGSLVASFSGWTDGG